MKKKYKLLLVIIAILLCISVGIFVRKYIINKNNPKEKNQIIELSEINNKYELKLLKSYDDYKNSKIYTERDLKNQNFKVHNYILLNIYNSSVSVVHNLFFATESTIYCVKSATLSAT